MSLKRLKSPDVISRLRMRDASMRAIREYFWQNDFVEVDSPVLISANCIETHIDPIKVGNQYLHTSPEAYHKRLLSYGAERIFQLGHVFRDEERGRLHSREFMLLEWYRTGASLNDLIVDCENVFRRVSVCVPGAVLAFTKDFERRSMNDLWLELAKIDLYAILKEIREGNAEALVKAVLGAGFHLRPSANFEDAFHHVMMTAIEPQIGQANPCVVNRWPVQMAGLARVCENDSLFADRFEIYFKGVELGNAFVELTDSNEQKRRFESDLLERSLLGKAPLPMPDDLLSDLDHIPPCAGIALGFDRLLMLICGDQQLSEVQPIEWV